MPMTQKEMIKLLRKHGDEKIDGGKGSHQKVKMPNIDRPVTVPHGELNKYTERSILKEAGQK